MVGGLLVIRSRWKVNTKVLDDLAAFAGDFTRIAGDIGEDLINQFDDGLLDELRYYPPPPANSSYVRTYRLREGWTVTIQRESEGFSIIINNPTPYAKYVVGSLATARATAASFQADIHKGRWPLTTDTVSFWFEGYLEAYQARFMNELGKFGTISSSRRAFTR